MDVWPLFQEVDSIKDTLEQERRSKKELASANVKLNGMLRVGQDAIKAEQDLVKQLQDQLTAKSKVYNIHIQVPGFKAYAYARVVMLSR